LAIYLAKLLWRWLLWRALSSPKIAFSKGPMNCLEESALSFYLT
jgi:hypothetical protein